MSITTSDFEAISILDSLLEDEFGFYQDQNQGLAVPCACFQEEDNSESVPI